MLYTLWHIWEVGVSTAFREKLPDMEVDLSWRNPDLGLHQQNANKIWLTDLILWSSPEPQIADWPEGIYTRRSSVVSPPILTRLLFLTRMTIITTENRTTRKSSLIPNEQALVRDIKDGIVRLAARPDEAIHSRPVPTRSSSRLIFRWPQQTSLVDEFIQSTKELEAYK